MAALLESSDTTLSDAEVARLQQLIQTAKKEDR